MTTTPLPTLATPKVQFFLTPALKKNLLAFLKLGDRKNHTGLHISRDATHSRFSLIAKETALHATFAIPHTVTAEPPTVQAQRHLLHAGRFLLEDSAAFLSLLRSAEPGHVIALGLTPAASKAYFSFRLGGQENRIAMDLANKSIKPTFYAEIAPTPAQLKNHTVHVNAAWARPVLLRALDFTSTDATREVLNGVFIESATDQPHLMSLVAVNGRFLIKNHFALHPSSLPLQPLADHIQPASLLRLSLPLLSACGCTSFRFGLDGPDDTPKSRPLHHLPLPDGCSISLLHATGIFGNFPNYRAVIPDITTGTLTLHLTDPAAAAKLCTDIGTVPDTRHIHLIIDGSHARLQGTGSAQFPIATVTGDTSAIDPNDPAVSAFDPSLLAPVLTHATRLHWRSPDDPIVATAPGLTFVVMPWRIKK